MGSFMRKCPCVLIINVQSITLFLSFRLLYWLPLQAKLATIIVILYVRFVVSIQSRICSGPMFSLLHLKAQQRTIVNVHFWLNFKHSPRRAPAGAGPWAHLHPSTAGRWKRTQSHEAESDHILRQAVLPFSSLKLTSIYFYIICYFLNY